jgi:hypothetical protein
MSTTEVSDRFTALPDERTLAETVLALEEHGFGVEVVDDLHRARRGPRPHPEGSSVTTDMSVTLQETEIADAIDHRATSSAGPDRLEPMIAAGGRRHDEL